MEIKLSDKEQALYDDVVRSGEAELMFRFAYAIGRERVMKENHERHLAFMKEIDSIFQAVRGAEHGVVIPPPNKVETI